MTDVPRARWDTRVCVLTTACALLLTSAAGAQNTEEERKALFRDGSAAADAGQWAAAAEKFRRVVEIRSAPKALIALAIAEEHLGRLADAKHHYEKASTDAHTSQLAEDEATATQALAALAPRLPVVAVHVPNPDHVQGVTLDGKTIPARDADYSVDPGQHTIVGHGDSDFRRVVDLKEGERAEVLVDIEPTRAPNKTHAFEHIEATRVPIGAIVLGAVGIASVGVASGLWAVGEGQQSDVQTLCGGTTNCPLALKGEADSSRANIIGGDVVFGLGAALAAVGATWLVVALVSHGRANATAWVSPTGFGMVGRW
jgi:hypothetical protein